MSTRKSLSALAYRGEGHLDFELGFVSAPQLDELSMGLHRPGEGGLPGMVRAEPRVLSVVRVQHSGTTILDVDGRDGSVRLEVEMAAKPKTVRRLRFGVFPCPPGSVVRATL